MTPPTPRNVAKPPENDQPSARQPSPRPALEGDVVSKLRAERDRYVALAFAAGDLLLELDAERRVRMASGACQALCGRTPADLLGREIGELATDIDRSFLARVLDSVAAMGRLDPVAVSLSHAEGGETRALMGACQIPSAPDRIFVTLTLLPGGGLFAPARDPETGLLEEADLLKVAQQAVTGGVAQPPRELALIRLDGLGAAKSGLPEERSKLLMREIGAVIRAASLGGDAAGRIGDDAFGLVRGLGQDLDRLPGAVGKLAADSGIAPDAITAKIAKVALDSGALSEAEAARALAYVVKHFSEATDNGFTLTSLADGLPAALEQAVARYSSVNRLIGKDELQLVFQPIVALANRAIHHHEVLSRFPDGQSPYEVISFSEEVGLIEELDLSVCRKAVAELERKDGSVLAVNISGRSIQNPQFRSSLQAFLNEKAGLAARLIFELTESAIVQEVAAAVTFLDWLRGRGHRVCLDDFGAGATAYNYLRHFDVDFVKIDGPFLKAALKNGRERALVGSIARLCGELGSATIGEMIETEADASAAADLGIGFGQGWLYGKPANEPVPQTAKNAADPGWAAVKRPRRAVR